MEFVTTVTGHIAPRLNDITLSAEQFRRYFAELTRHVVRMLCAGIVRGDLSEYNVLMGSKGLVIIDLPQAINASHFSSARGVLIRDLDNLAAYFRRFASDLIAPDYGKEISALYQSGKLHPDVVLTGDAEHENKPVDLAGVLRTVDLVLKKEAAWQRYKWEMWRGLNYR